MNREIVLPAWLSVLSLAVALFVPLGVSLIADTSMDTGHVARKVAHDGGGRFIPPDATAGQRDSGRLDHRV